MNLCLIGVWGLVVYNFFSFNGEDWMLIRGGYGGVEFGCDFFVGWGGYEICDDIKFNDGDDEFNFCYYGLVIGIVFNLVKMIYFCFIFIVGSGCVWIDNKSDGDCMFVF